jgi:hypothetical protein
VNFRTFYNDFIEAIGRTANMQVDVKVHSQLDGGAIFEAVVKDARGRVVQVQNLEVSMSEREKFSDTFLSEGLKADILAERTSSFRKTSPPMGSKRRPVIPANTTDKIPARPLKESEEEQRQALESDVVPIAG